VGKKRSRHTKRQQIRGNRTYFDFTKVISKETSKQTAVESQTLQSFATGLQPRFIRQRKAAERYKEDEKRRERRLDSGGIGKVSGGGQKFQSEKVEAGCV